MNTRALLSMIGLGLVALGFFLWLDRTPSAARLDGATRPTEDSASVGRVRSGALQSSGLAPEAPAPAADREVAAASTAPNGEAAAEGLAPAGPRAKLRGRVVDESGTAIEGAQLLLAAFMGWGAPGQGTELDAERNLFGYEQLSGQDGRFEFDVPVPGTNAQLEVGAGPWRTFVTRFFSVKGLPYPDLAAGVRDLGEIVLSPAGTLEGWVTDAAGTGVSGAKVYPSTAEGFVYGDSAKAGVDGHFVIEHLPPGNCFVEATAVGYLTSDPQAVSIERGVAAPILRLVLQPGQRLTGRLVDEAGRGVPNLGVGLDPVLGGFTSSFTSDAEGRFEVQLRVLGAQMLRLKGLGWEWVDREMIDPELEGLGPLELVLRPWVKTRFVVRDRITGAAIERFGLRIRPNFGSRGSGQYEYRARDLLPIEEHPGGLVELPARPGADAYVVAAPGYAYLLEEVLWSESGAPDCVVELDPCGGLLGRVTDGHTGLEGLDWRLEFNASGLLTLEQRTGRTDSEGRFQAAGLVGGPYRLTVKDQAGQRLVLEQLNVQGAAVMDLGDLVLGGLGSLLVRLRMPLGQDLARVNIVAEGPGGKLELRTDEQGIVRFEDLSPGPWRVRCWGTERVGDSSVVAVNVSIGEEAEVELDLRARQLCELSLAFEASRGATKGWTFNLIPAEGLLSVSGDGPRNWNNLPTALDAGGRWSGRVAPTGRTRIALHTEPGLSLQLEQPVLELNPGARVEARVRVAFGALEVTWPEIYRLPEAGSLELTLDSLTAANYSVSHWGRLPPAAGLPGYRKALEVETNRLRCAQLPPGRYRVTLKLPKDGVQLLGEERQFLEFAPGVTRLTGEVTARDGETAQVTLE